MNIDTRARRAAQGIHEAVEVREMTMQTKDPKPVERFDQYKDKKELNRRRGAFIAAAAVVILAAVLVIRTLGGGEASVPADDGGGAVGTASGVVDGKWQTATITPADVRTFLEAEGLGGAADAVVAANAYPTSFIVSMDGNLYGVTDADGTYVDSGFLSVDGDRVTFDPKNTTGDVVYTWSMEGDTLILTFVSDSSPDYKGFPDEAFNRTIYELSPLNPAA